MSATPAINGAYKPVSEDDAIPPRLHRKLAAAAQVGRGQFVTVSLSSGNAALNDGTVPLQASAGCGDPSVLSDTDAGAGNAQVRLSQRHVKGLPASSISLDSFTDTDFGVPFWIKDENTPGKLSNSGGSNRSIGGLVFGLGDDGNPVLWPGPVAWLVARAALQADNASAGLYQYPADAAAGTDYAAAIPISREKRHGVITAIEILPSATLAITSGNDRVITIKKRDSLGVAAAVSVATFTSTTAMPAPNAANCLTALLPTQMVLSVVAGALNMLETDYLTIENSHVGTGAVVPASAIRATMKVI